MSGQRSQGKDALVHAVLKLDLGAEERPEPIKMSRMESDHRIAEAFSKEVLEGGGHVLDAAQGSMVVICQVPGETVAAKPKWLHQCSTSLQGHPWTIQGCRQEKCEPWDPLSAFH